MFDRLWPLDVLLESMNACFVEFTQGEVVHWSEMSPPRSWLLRPVMGNYDRKEGSDRSSF